MCVAMTCHVLCAIHVNYVINFPPLVYIRKCQNLSIMWKVHIISTFCMRVWFALQFNVRIFPKPQKLHLLQMCSKAG